MRIYVKRDQHDTESDAWEVMSTLKDMKLSTPPTVYLLGFEDRDWDDYEQSISYLAEVVKDDGLVKLRRVR